MQTQASASPIRLVSRISSDNLISGQRPISLAEIVAEPSKIAELPVEAIASLRGELAKLDTIFLARLLSGTDRQEAAGPDGDKLLSVKEAAAKLRKSANYLYRHSRTLPFTVRMGRTLRFSEAGIERYIRQRMGR